VTQEELFVLIMICERNSHFIDFTDKAMVFDLKSRGGLPFDMVKIEPTS